MLGLFTGLVLAAAAMDPVAVVLVGVRGANGYQTAALAPASSVLPTSAVAEGLIVPTIVGLMLVDVVNDCPAGPNEEPWQRLVVKPVSDKVPRLNRLRCPDSPRGASLVSVLFASRTHLSVSRHSWGYRSERDSISSLDTRAWGHGTPLPLSAALGKVAVDTVSHATRERRNNAISEALREGLGGDANPCWYPDANDLSWGVSRKQQRWVISALLVSDCTTEYWDTPVDVPDVFIDGVLSKRIQIQKPPSTRSANWDVVQSPDGRWVIIQDGSAIELRALEGTELGTVLGRVDLGGGSASDDKTLVMVEWLEQTAFGPLQPSLVIAFRAR